LRTASNVEFAISHFVERTSVLNSWLSTGLSLSLMVRCYCAGPRPILKRMREGTAEPQYLPAEKYFDCT